MAEPELSTERGDIPRHPILGHSDQSPYLCTFLNTDIIPRLNKETDEADLQIIRYLERQWRRFQDTSCPTSILPVWLGSLIPGDPIVKSQYPDDDTGKTSLKSARSHLQAELGGQPRGSWCIWCVYEIYSRPASTLKSAKFHIAHVNSASKTPNPSIVYSANTSADTVEV